jgi:large exoprotein involved in heme utilization and adhesion
MMIDAFIIGLKNSDIIANAFQGQGSSIQITTQGIFGLKYRLQIKPDSDIRFQRNIVLLR